MRTIPAGRSAEKGTMYTGQKRLAVRPPTHPVCGLRTAGAPVALLDAGRPVFLDQAVIDRPVEVQAPGAPFEARRRHPGQDNLHHPDGCEMDSFGISREDLADRSLDLRR